MYQVRTFSFVPSGCGFRVLGLLSSEEDRSWPSIGRTMSGCILILKDQFIVT
jgi:hypothetical protein